MSRSSGPRKVNDGGSKDGSDRNEGEQRRQTDDIPPAVTRLTEYLRGIGPYLRRVVYYDDDRAEIVYIREDVRQKLSPDRRERIVNDLRIDAFAQSQQEQVYSNGRLNCVLRSFEKAFELNLILSETEGVAVSFDPKAFTRWCEFMDRCVEILQGD